MWIQLLQSTQFSVEKGQNSPKSHMSHDLEDPHVQFFNLLT